MQVAVAQLSSLERQASACKVAGLMHLLGIVRRFILGKDT